MGAADELADKRIILADKKGKKADKRMEMAHKKIECLLEERLFPK
nr:hypothetical protein [Neobacillus sp. Marseille-Q6967]